MSAISQLSTDVGEQRDAFIGQFMQSVTGALNVFTIYIGDRLGLYRALAEGGSLTSEELAARTGTHERYIREWLEQQTVAGVLQVEDERAAPTARRYRIPAGHAEALIDCDSLNYVAPLAQLVASAVKPLPALLKAYRHGGGVPYSEYGEDMREGQAAINYGVFSHLLAQEWLPAIPDVHQRLLADPPAQVADLGCGHGWSSIGIAKGYPGVIVDGFDLDAPSIDRARANANSSKLNGCVQFHVRDASDPALAGKYDLVTAFECIHDMSNPVGALRTMRNLAGEHGVVLVMDERVGENFTAVGDDVERLMYGYSALHCLPVGMADPPAVGTGTVMRTDTLRRYAQDAGFRSVEILPIEHFMFRFYRLHA